MNQTEDEVLQDFEYWDAFGKRLGWRVYGWTYRLGCSYDVEGNLINITAAQRDTTMAFLDKKEETK